MPFLRLSLLLAACCLLDVSAARAQKSLPGLAQSSQPQLPSVPGEVGTPPPFPAGVNGNPANPVNPVIPASQQQATVVLDFANSSVTDVLNYYETLSNKHIIADNTVQGQVTLHIARPVTPDAAMRMIETALYMNGFQLVPGDDDVVKVIGLGKPSRSFGVPIYFDVADLPDSEEVVTLFNRLDNLDPQETSGLLVSYIPPNSNAVAFTPFPKAHALLITDSARSVRRLHALVAQLDKPGPDIKEKFIKLERADATKAVEFLNNVFETKNSSGSAPAASTGAAIPGAPILPGSAPRRPIRRVDDSGAVVDSPGLITNAGGTTTLNRDSLIVGKVTLTAEPRTNRVHVVTTEANMEIIEKLLADYDSNTTFAAPVRFPLKFIRPDQLLPILVQSLQEGGDDKNATPGATNPNKNGQSNANNNSSFGSNNSFGGLNSSGFGSNSGFGSSGFGGSNGLGYNSTSSTETIDTTPQEAVVGNTRLIADVSNSSIILLGGQDAREKVTAIIDQLDRRSPQVVIRTIIGELAIGNNRELGFQYLLRTKRLGLTNNAGLFANSGSTATPSSSASPTSSVTGLNGTSALGALSSLATGLSSNFSGIGGVIAVGQSLDIILAALESTNRFKAISSPRIVTSNFKKASIISGQTITVSTGNVTTTSGATGVANSLSQELAALQLDVTPQINSDKEVFMEVNQKLNSPLGTTSTTSGSSNQDLSVRELHNFVSARNGETIVLGGLITQNDNISNSNIPYLSRIPVLGNLFRAHTRNAERTELIILMQPEVVDTAGVMASIKEREENKTYLGHDLDRQIDPIVPVRKAIPVRTTTTTTVRTRTATAIPAGK